MGFLPDMKDGHLVENSGDEKIFLEIVAMLPADKRTKVEHNIREHGMSAERALKDAGIVTCVRR